MARFDEVVGPVAEIGKYVPNIPGHLTWGNLGSYITGYTPQMILGTFVFALNTAAFQELLRSTEYRWGSQDVFGGHEVLQYLGPGSDTILLPGVIYPAYRGGIGQLDKMRSLGASGQPQLLMDATGAVLGYWVVEGVEEKRSTLMAFGIPRKQEFILRLRHFEGLGLKDLIDSIRGLI